MLSFRCLCADQFGQVSPVKNRALVKGSCRRNIEQLDIFVFVGIVLLCRVEQQDRIKLQAFGVGHRKNHDAISEFRILFRSVRHLKTFMNPAPYLLGFLLIPADNRNRIIAVFLPVLYRGHGGCIQILLRFAIHNAHIVAMPHNWFHRIDREVSMPQYLCCKMRDLHGISIAFLQYTKGVVGSGQY